jgi:hypothetical protein
MEPRAIACRQASSATRKDAVCKKGVFSHAGRAPASTSAYMEMLKMLPGLHAAALKLMRVLIQAGGHSLKPLHKGLGRLLGTQLRRLATDSAMPTVAAPSWLVRGEVGTAPPWGHTAAQASHLSTFTAWMLHSRKAFVPAGVQVRCRPDQIGRLGPCQGSGSSRIAVPSSGAVQRCVC